MKRNKLVQLYNSLRAIGIVSPSEVPESLLSDGKTRETIASYSKLAQGSYKDFETAVMASGMPQIAQLDSMQLQAAQGGNELELGHCGHTWEGTCTPA